MREFQIVLKTVLPIVKMMLKPATYSLNNIPRRGPKPVL